MIEKQPFGIVNGQQAMKYILTNRHGVQLTCLDYGATWLKLEVPVAGQRQNLLLTSPDITGYTLPSDYHGKSIGRVAGRIGAGQYSIKLPTNEGTTTLHGGPRGFSSLLWNTTVENNQVYFKRRITADEDGFPGSIDVSICYTLTDNDDVIIDYWASSHQNTLFNPTNHVYWNLNAGDRTVQNHQLLINSSQHFETKANKVPTGVLLANAHSGFDLARPTNIGDALQIMQTTPERGYDDIFWIEEHATRLPVARLSQGSLAVTMYSSRNALVVFTANQFDQELQFEGKTSRPYIGIALEAQTAPSAVDNPLYGDITLQPEKPRHEQISYHFEY